VKIFGSGASAVDGEVLQPPWWSLGDDPGPPSPRAAWPIPDARRFSSIVFEGMTSRPWPKAAPLRLQDLGAVMVVPGFVLPYAELVLAYGPACPRGAGPEAETRAYRDTLKTALRR
jgi:hypothetical protein